MPELENPKARNRVEVELSVREWRDGQIYETSRRIGMIELMVLAAAEDNYFRRLIQTLNQANQDRISAKLYPKTEGGENK